MQTYGTYHKSEKCLRKKALKYILTYWLEMAKKNIPVCDETFWYRKKYLYLEKVKYGVFILLFLFKLVEKDLVK